jgi:hypothetical protein
MGIIDDLLGPDKDAHDRAYREGSRESGESGCLDREVHGIFDVMTCVVPGSSLHQTREAGYHNTYRQTSRSDSSYNSDSSCPCNCSPSSPQQITSQARSSGGPGYALVAFILFTVFGIPLLGKKLREEHFSVQTPSHDYIEIEDYGHHTFTYWSNAALYMAGLEGGRIPDIDKTIEFYSKAAEKDEPEIVREYARKKISERLESYLVESPILARQWNREYYPWITAGINCELLDKDFIEGINKGLEKNPNVHKHQLKIFIANANTWVPYFTKKCDWKSAAKYRNIIRSAKSELDRLE